MDTVYSIKADSHDSHEVLPLLRELLSRRPEARYLEPWELQALLWSPHYTNELLDEGAIAAALEVARTDLDPEAGTAA